MKKVGYFFFCFLPLLSSIALQFIAFIPVMGIGILQISFRNLLSGKKAAYNEFLMQITSVFSNRTFVMAASVLYAIFGILIFGFWYQKQFHGDLRFPLKRFARPGIVLGILLLVPGLQIASSLLTAVSASIFPNAMDFYESLMESAGLTQQPSLLLFLYAVLLGPAAEELTFRGVTLSSAQKALPFWAANLFQAVLFGFFHMNLIQGIYAFFIGLFLGYVCKRSGSIWFSIFLHILFNSWGTFASSQWYSLPIIPLFLLLGIFGIFLFHKNTSVLSIKNFPDFSDM